MFLRGEEVAAYYPLLMILRGEEVAAYYPC